MIRVYVGALMMVGGIAAFIEAHSNHPVAAYVPVPQSPMQELQLERAGLSGASTGTPASGLTPTAYDLLHIAGWALLLLGSLTVILGLIGYLRTTPRMTHEAT
jgi:hypothetical protein